jgi:hypothetical protein
MALKCVELPSVSQTRSGQDAEAVSEGLDCGKRCVFLWQSTTSRAFSASPIAFCVLGTTVCLARLVGDVSSFGPEPLITVQALLI